MFRRPLRRDPLVVGWAVVLLLAAFVALNANTEWSGSVEPERVAGFIIDLATAFLWSFFLLLLLAWLRARGWFGDAAGPAPKHPKPEQPRSALPWTDRWIRDWRQEAAQGRPAGDAEPELLACRHGVPAGPVPDGQVPVLRAISVSHTIVRPGSEVLVTWCFEHARDVLVDGHPAHPPCGEALVRIDASRRVDVTGRNRFTTTPAATPVVAAVAVPQLDLPSVAAPPPVSLRADVAATVGAPSPVTDRLDAFWATQDALRPRIEVSPRLVGVPDSLLDSLRRAGRKDTP
ncbi:hypothetical protein [Geodermatophilus sp. SYSU D00698]